MPTLEEVLASYADRLGQAAGNRAAERVLRALEERGVIPPEGFVAEGAAVVPSTSTPRADAPRRPVQPIVSADRPPPGGTYVPSLQQSPGQPVTSAPPIEAPPITIPATDGGDPERRPLTGARPG